MVHRLPRYAAKRVRRDHKMLYEVEGRCYPGVTTVLSATKPQEAREALQRWRQRVGVDEAQRISGNASSAGTRLHKQIAAHLNGKPVEISADLAGYWASIQSVLAQVEEVLLVEGAVWHRAGFVGFPDALVMIDGELYLCDWKTALRPKQPQWLEDYFLQIAAYRAAATQVYADFGLEVQKGLVAIALADQPAQRFEVSLAEMNDHWQQFQRRLREFEYRRRR
ncbi:PD-(D/E)XK nuclease family protein [Nodosilinea sp. E11]|uniref:PD-(D/E)XK nuclease family protein n=1 Tax=Nodosilinea sp. E11 TaxID=3037479 RepID=UPI0029343B89|nr:PD-(D/E)XK nuclease family protein [Nodosilinea sp. E11]WOD39845.1 PD-(D/E)XK nuclease family protein [Nodosilinea sp. E11]